jgi:hypothetical protein
MTTVTFASAGSSSWLCPAGVTSVLAECWGAGGAGAGGNTAHDPGGSGGEYAADTVAVTPGASYSYTAGAPGTGGSFASGGNGGSSAFAGDSLTVTAHGGTGGILASSSGPAGGTGSTNTTHFDGGAGGAGAGGGGGGSGGTSSAGNAGGTTSGAAAVAGGGPGGNGASGNGSSPASGPGGGGGAGGSFSAGAAGFAGQVRITYASVVSVAGQPAAVTVAMPAGTISNNVVISGDPGAVTTAMPAGTISSSATVVSGTAAAVTVTMPAGTVSGPPVSITGPPMRVTVNSLAGTVSVAPSGPASIRAEHASLIIASQVELLGGGVVSGIPACAGARFMLGPGYDLGTQQPVTDIVGELITDGERPFGRRSSNRTLTLPVVITAPDIATLTAARETLISLIDQPSFTVTWTRDGGLPLVLDCFRAQATTMPYSVRTDRALVGEMTLQIQALPYGRSDIPQQLTFASPASGSPAPPPSPVLLDDYESVSGADWSPSTSRITGTFSAHWSNPEDAGFFGFFGGQGSAAVYTSTFGPVSIAGRTTLQHWAGFASPSFYYYWQSQGMVAQFAYVLRDSSGRTLRFGTSVSSVVPAAGSVPNWILVSATIPSSSGFDFSAVVSCAITITNGGGVLASTDAWLDGLSAQPVTTGAGATIRGSLYTLHGIQGTSHAPLALQLEQPDLAPFRTLIAHRPGPDSPVSLTPFVSTTHVTDPPDGRQYAVTSQIAGVNARFSGTYSIVAVANSWNNPSASRTVTVTVYETEYAGGPATSQSVSRTFTPATDVQNGIAVIGELTLPGLDIPPDNIAMFHTAGITDTNRSDQFLDVLFLDTTGQTVIINESQPYSVYYLDEPSPDRDLGRILGSNSDRKQAISVLDSAFVSGGPLTVDPLPAVSNLLVYSAEGAPSLLATYSARWFLDRIG